MSSDKRSTKPAHEVKVGFVKAVIWPNETTSGIRYNVTLARLYKQGDTWKSTTSFGIRDLFDVVRASVLAESWIQAQTPPRNVRAELDRIEVSDDGYTVRD